MKLAPMPVLKTMPNRVLAAVLIVLSLGLGLVAGPHPCSLQQAQQAQVENGRPEAPCHGEGSGAAMEGMGDQAAHAAPTRAGQPAHGQSPANCCDNFCQHACQMPAIGAAQPVTFAIVPVAQSFVEPSDSGLPLFVPVFDHVPLA